ncbi:hypothetical protein R1flu_012496 [Riccia fluitans]|uniref:Uncharacterized protein n=1 Tax=Riccia fluitans TaxID=41844 RepID=A0ABD1ZAS0_9MARC
MEMAMDGPDDFSDQDMHVEIPQEGYFTDTKAKQCKGLKQHRENSAPVLLVLTIWRVNRAERNECQFNDRITFRAGKKDDYILDRADDEMAERGDNSSTTTTLLIYDLRRFGIVRRQRAATSAWDVNGDTRKIQQRSCLGRGSDD